MNDVSVALYRKYRPQEFSEVRNQEHIVTVLEGAIKKKMIPHALLFTGSRGTGKTTVARIFAKSIGATERDTYEIDAASNRGIDDIRDLNEAVYTMPYESPYKVYIIDEVHMLTKEAFNALLKTLEEPPSHVVFILATTEQDKLLDTITSRCQVFQFKAPSRAALRERVLDITKKEKFKLDAAAADMIAIAADGSFRDAIGITQKVIMASKDSAADADEVATIVGAPKGALLMDILSALHTGDPQKGLKAIQDAHDAHVDMKFFIRLLLERVRTVILLRNGGAEEEELLEQYDEEDKQAVLSYVGDKQSSINSHALLRLLEAAEQTGKTYLPQLPLELALIDLTSKES